MSSREQVVIPESIRIGCGFGEGTTFTVVAKGNAVMMQAIVAPPRDLFNELAREFRTAAKAAGMRPSDITAARTVDSLHSLHSLAQHIVE